MQNIGKYLERESLICETLDEISDDYSMCVGCCKVKCNDLGKCYLLLGNVLKGVAPFELLTSCGLCGNDYLFCVDCCGGTLLSRAPNSGAGGSTPNSVLCFECVSEARSVVGSTKRRRGDDCLIDCASNCAMHASSADILRALAPGPGESCRVVAQRPRKIARVR